MSEPHLHIHAVQGRYDDGRGTASPSPIGGSSWRKGLHVESAPQTAPVQPNARYVETIEELVDEGPQNPPSRSNQLPAQRDQDSHAGMATRDRREHVEPKMGTDL